MKSHSSTRKLFLYRKPSAFINYKIYHFSEETKKKKHCLITFIRLMSTFNQRLMTLIFCVKCEWKRPKCSRKEDLKDKQCIFKRVYLFNSLNNHFFFHLWMVLTKIGWERLINEVNVFSFWGGGYDTLLLKQGKILFWNIFQFPFAQKWFFAKFFYILI